MSRPVFPGSIVRRGRQRAADWKSRASEHLGTSGVNLITRHRDVLPQAVLIGLTEQTNLRPRSYL